MIFDEKYGMKPSEESMGGLGTIDEDQAAKKYAGEVRDTIIFAREGVHEIAPGIVIEAKEGDQYEMPVGHNLVVDSFSRLIAALIKREAGYSGALFWEVGAGNSSWNDNSPPNPVATDTALLAASFRKSIALADMKFLDASNNVTASLTNKLQIELTFGTTEANGYLREFGIFGGNATATLGSGQMINRKTHGVIFKTSGLELKRTLRFTF